MKGFITLPTTPVTRVSLKITDVAVVLDAATQLLKIYRARGAAKGRAGEALTDSLGLEDAIVGVMTILKETIGQQ